MAHLILHGIPEINKQLMLDTTNEIHKSTLTKEDVSTSDYVSKVLELRGECEPFQFTLDPPAIFVPGSTYMQTTTRKAFRVISVSYLQRMMINLRVFYLIANKYEYLSNQFYMETNS